MLHPSLLACVPSEHQPAATSVPDDDDERRRCLCNFPQHLVYLYDSRTFSCRPIFYQIDQVQDTLEQGKISLFTPEFVLPPERFISQENGGVTLTVKGDSWFLRYV